MPAALPKAPRACPGVARGPLLEVPFSTSCARTCQHSNAQFASRMHLRDVSTRLVPNSHGIIPFTDPHPLNPVLSYRYKNIGGQGALPGLQRSKVQPSNVSTCLDHHLFTSLLRYVLTPTSFPYLVTSLPPYFLFSKSFPCHTSENSPVSPTIATLPKRGVSNPSLCHTSETPGGGFPFSVNSVPSEASVLNPILLFTDHCPRIADHRSPNQESTGRNVQLFSVEKFFPSASSALFITARPRRRFLLRTMRKTSQKPGGSFSCAFAAPSSASGTATANFFRNSGSIAPMILVMINRLRMP